MLPACVPPHLFFYAVHGGANVLYGDGGGAGTGTQTAKRIILHIQTENKTLDLGSLEDGLETQDRSSSLFYGGDDLSHDQVVTQAQAS